MGNGEQWPCVQAGSVTVNILLLHEHTQYVFCSKLANGEQWPSVRAGIVTANIILNPEHILHFFYSKSKPEFLESSDPRERQLKEKERELTELERELRQRQRDLERERNRDRLRPPSPQYVMRNSAFVAEAYRGCHTCACVCVCVDVSKNVLASVCAPGDESPVLGALFPNPPCVAFPQVWAE